jgi:uncharacterized protein YwbE
MGQGIGTTKKEKKVEEFIKVGIELKREQNQKAGKITRLPPLTCVDR